MHRNKSRAPPTKHGSVVQGNATMKQNRNLGQAAENKNVARSGQERKRDGNTRHRQGRPTNQPPNQPRTSRLPRCVNPTRGKAFKQTNQSTTKSTSYKSLASLCEPNHSVAKPLGNTQLEAARRRRVLCTSSHARPLSTATRSREGVRD